MTGPSECSLLVVVDERHFFDGTHYRCTSSFGYFVTAIAAHMRRTTMAVPTTREGPPFGHVGNFPNVEFCELPYWDSTLAYLRLRGGERRRLRDLARQLVADHDAVLLRMPALAAGVFADQARRQAKVLAASVVANVLKAANPLHSANPLVRVAARLFTRYVHRKTMKIVRHAQLTLAIGSELRELCRKHNPATRLFMETVISQRDLYQRDDSLPAAGPIVLFRAARTDPNKGTEYLLQALALLVQRGLDLRLRLAGRDSGPAYLAQLQQQARQLGIADRVDWLGEIPFGATLYELYRTAHIGVLCSLSEGFPRFINEAWAFSLPVVSTRLPSLSPPVVPDENAVLVECRSGPALADGIQRVIEDATLRRRIIAGGMRLVRQATLEHQSRQVAELIAAATDSRRLRKDVGHHVGPST